MRQLLFIALFIVFFLSWQTPVDNPLKNTQWSGKVNAPDPYDGTFVFTADTTTLYINGGVIETSLYKVSGDTLKMVKLNGMSSCGYSDTGYYKYNIKDSVLTITLIKDNCSDRGNAFSAEGYKASHNSF